MGSAGLDPAAVEQFVGDRFESVSCIELLAGGEWSTAFGFRSSDRSLVIRFGHHIEDYQKDEMATAQYQAFAGGDDLEATARHTERLLDQL